MQKIKISASRRMLFVVVFILLIGCLLEAVGFVGWKAGVLTPKAKATILSLCGQSRVEPHSIPNAFWHHSINPRAFDKGLVNEKGTLGRNFEVPKPEGEFRIICIGDSTVEGLGIDRTKSFPLVLQRMFDRDIKKFPRYKNITVINAGVSNHNSAFNLAHLAFRLINYEPDMVIIKSAYNDYLPYLVKGMKYDYTHAFPEPFFLPPKNGSNNPYWHLARYSYYLKLVGFFLYADDVNFPFKNYHGYVTQEGFMKVEDAEKKDFKVYSENIRSMILLCKGRGIDVMLLDLPWVAPHMKQLIAGLEANARKVASEEGVPFVDTAHLLNKDDFYDHCHNTISGNEKNSVTTI